MNPSASNGFDWTPLVLSLLAGLFTCVGASVVFCAQRQQTHEKDKLPLSHKHICISIAFAGSVMITVSLFSLLPESFEDESIKTSYYVALSPYSRKFWERVAWFIAGNAVVLLLSKCAFPDPDSVLELKDERETDHVMEAIANGDISCKSINNRRQEEQLQSTVKRQSCVASSCDPKEVSPPPIRIANTDPVIISSEYTISPETVNPYSFQWSTFTSGADLTSAEARRSWRVTMLLFMSLLAHNFPEGVAVAASSVHSHRLGVTTALAIAFHNIPEGIAIAVPCYAARPDYPWLAFGLGCLSGLAEPVGAFVALMVMRYFQEKGESSPSSSWVVFSTESVLSFVAGIMITVAMNDLFPEALRHAVDGKGPFLLGIIVGAVVMIASDTLLDALY